MSGKVLLVAGSDSDSFAQADIKTVTALGGKALAAKSVSSAIEALLRGTGVDAIKIGMLPDEAAIDAVSAALDATGGTIPWVVDPVMRAKGGAAALNAAASHALKAKLILHATVLTPNVQEAEVLTGMTIAHAGDLERAAHMLLTLGPKAVLLKGGQLASETVQDLLVGDGILEWFRGPRLGDGPNKGAGGTLASGIAAGLARGMALRDAVAKARDYTNRTTRPAS
jgi:hydroxymethylpyrimidine/phosphomethylpyrimidine kinase